MKNHLIFGAVLTFTIAHAAVCGTNLDDPSFDSMPEAGISVFTTSEAEGQLIMKIVDEDVYEGSACLEIALPVAAYASVSFPLKNASASMDLEFAYRVEAGDGAEVKIGIQSFTMDGGFESVDFRPLVPPGQTGTEWKLFYGQIERAEAATHWQISVAINGPATVWLDEINAQPK